MGAPPREQDRARRRPSREMVRARYGVLLFLADTAAITAAFLLAALAYPAERGEAASLLLGAILPVYMLLSALRDAFAARWIDEPRRGVLIAVRAYAMAVGVTLFVAFYLKVSVGFSRVTLGIGSGLSMLLLAIGRTVVLGRARRVLADAYNVLLVTDRGRTAGGEAWQRLDACRHAEFAGGPEGFERLAWLTRDIDRVVIDCGERWRDRWLDTLRGANVQVECVVDGVRELAPLAVGRFGPLPTLVVARGPLSLADRVVKRGFDVTVSLAALIVLWPLLMATALAIKLDSDGPILFRQTRIGRCNRPFTIYKFRSMRVPHCDGGGARSAVRGDDRCTAVGRLIRRTSIDELPQLFNVLTGSMSIVGPRPHAVASRAGDELFWHIDSRYWHRHAIKPGLTGLAQVRGFRGATGVRSDLTNRLQSDLEYLNGWSIARDCVILLRTLGVLAHPNAF